MSDQGRVQAALVRVKQAMSTQGEGEKLVIVCEEGKELLAKIMP